MIMGIRGWRGEALLTIGVVDSGSNVKPLLFSLSAFSLQVAGRHKRLHFDSRIDVNFSLSGECKGIRWDRVNCHKSFYMENGRMVYFISVTS